MIIEIEKNLNGSILDVGGGGEAIIGQIYKDNVIAIDNKQEELDEAPNCCKKMLMDATELLFTNNYFDNVTFFYSLMYMNKKEQYQSILEATRVLKKDGLISIWDCDICKAYPEPFSVELDIKTSFSSTHTTYGIIKKDTQSCEFIINICECAGLRIKHIEKNGKNFFIQCVK